MAGLKERKVQMMVSVEDRIDVRFTESLDHGDIDIFPWEDDGDRPNPRCEWDDSVCLETPTHAIIWAVPDGREPDGDEATLWCARHFATFLARFAARHRAETFCNAPLSKHFAYLGPISGVA